jgi:ABC-type spermidine/putrescine transport system permease subunit I
VGIKKDKGISSSTLINKIGLLKQLEINYNNLKLNLGMSYIVLYCLIMSDKVGSC